MLIDGLHASIIAGEQKEQVKKDRGILRGNPFTQWRKNYNLSRSKEQQQL